MRLPPELLLLLLLLLLALLTSFSEEAQPSVTDRTEEGDGDPRLLSLKPPIAWGTRGRGGTLAERQSHPSGGTDDAADREGSGGG